ncbi:uncharacterized protein LOC577848 isoform X2 [Strongylocentrotus purpuratus]|uniref:Uncharacterized protein n=1 Tax=Strongylocentrotus purpuratus TaxID=7668 RepID=A0A7M7THK1_STRPU|nr:uncharacterized protein LOC577848 isoform X2 [Strongylocentrotus purpuratus]|eukprot:XP_801724.1 PREDICTED: fibronectin type III domain-containing protein 1 isoform X2 [Strongylocentrotus purpuratus]
MRDRKAPDDEYNRRLHIYAETPGLQQTALVPASEKELNAPKPPPASSAPATTQGHSSIQTHPYARIPGANFVEEEEEDDVDRPVSRSATGASSSSSQPTSSSLPAGTSGVGRFDGEVNGTPVEPVRDPIYAELDLQNSEDDRIENDLGGNSVDQTAILPSSTSLRTSDVILNSSQSRPTCDEQSRTVPPRPPAKRQVPLPGSSIAKKLDLGRGSGPNSKTIRTHTRLDASLEIPATQRPKLPGTKQNDDGVTLFRKTDRNSEVEQPTTSTSKNANDAKTTVNTSGIILKHVRSIDGQTSTTYSGEVNDEEEIDVAMPVDPDLDAGTAIIKKKQRFRRNMILIISFLMVLLVVVAAVIIALVIVTKDG